MKNSKATLIGCAMIIFIAIAGPGFAGEGKFSIGGLGGWSKSVVGEAVDGYADTEFEGAGVFGGSVLYRFSSGLTLGAAMEHYTMDLVEDGEDFGALSMTPVLVLLRFQGMPENGTGLTGHAEVGAGISFNSFDKGTVVTDSEKATGLEYSVDTDNSFILTLGLGADYFLTEHLAISLDGRLLSGNVDTTWEVSGPGGSATLDDIDTFHASNFQILGGVSYWF